MTTWLPEGFHHPLRAELIDGVHLRPISAADVDIDMLAVMANRDMLWSMFGEEWGWPPADMTREQDAADLARHAAEMQSHESFNYAVVTTEEDRLLGCVYIDPLEPDAEGKPRGEVSWWMVAEAPPRWREALDDFVPAWLAAQWPFASISTPFQPGNHRSEGSPRQ